MEQYILKKWDEEAILEKFIHKNNKSEKYFSFLDGPITANNPMGVHHAWGRTYKDVWQRYKNMQAFDKDFKTVLTVKVCGLRSRLKKNWV